MISACLNYYLLIWVFHISFSWWSYPGVWVTESPLKSPGLFSVFWLVSTRPPSSKSSSPFDNPLVTVPKAPITISIIVTFIFHSFFFNSLAMSRYLSFFSHSFSFILWSARTAKSTILKILFFYSLIIFRSGLLAEIRWSVYMSKSHGSLWYFPTTPLEPDMTQGHFLSGVWQVWIQSIPSPRLVASPRLKNQSALLFTHSWRENNWIHTFPKGISAMWNAISLVLDLNSCCRVHFLRR